MAEPDVFRSISLSCGDKSSTITYEVAPPDAYTGYYSIESTDCRLRDYGLGDFSINDWLNASAYNNSPLVTFVAATNKGESPRSVDVVVSTTWLFKRTSGDVGETVTTVDTVTISQDEASTILRFNPTWEDAGGGRWLDHDMNSQISIPFYARGDVGEIRVSCSSWLNAEIVGDRVVLTTLEGNYGSDSIWTEVHLTCEAGGFVYDPEAPNLFDSFPVGQVGRNHQIPADTDKRLATWQHSADDAYAVIYYRSKEDAGSDSEYTESILTLEFWDATERSKVGTVLIRESHGDVGDIRLFSVNDVLYICNENMFPKKVERHKDDAFIHGYRFDPSNIPVKIDPVLDEYADRNVFTVQSGQFSTGDSVVVTEEALTSGQEKNGASYLFGMDGAWRGYDPDKGGGGQMLMLKHPTEMMTTWGLLYTSKYTDEYNGHISSGAVSQTPRPNTVISNDKGGEGWDSGWFFVYGKISIETAGKWSGRLVVDLWKPDMEVSGGQPVSPEELAVLEVNNAAHNRSVSRDILDPGCRIRIRCVKRERAQSVTVTTKGEDIDIIYRRYDNDTGCYVTLSNAQEIPVYLRIKKVVKLEGQDGYATCEALHPFEGGFTSSSFAEGAWAGKKYGYPRCGGIFQERMVFGGNKIKPCTLWCSKTGDWSNFVQGSESTSPIFATANTDNIDAIQWMQATKSYIQFGSLSGEWYFGASDGAALKPSNFMFQRLSNFGSTRGVDAVLFGTSTIVAKNGGRQIIDVSYNTLSETGDGVDLSLLASHLFENEKVVDMAATLSPSSNLWVLGDKGTLLGFTYEANNNVYAWTRHTFLDGVKAITSFRRGERDILAMLVKDGAYQMLCEFDPFRGDDYVRDSEDPVYGEQVFLDERASSGFSRYESRIVPTPIVFPDGLAYGRKASCRAMDVYLRTHNGDFDGLVSADGTQFNVKIGNSAVFVCDNGWLETNELKEFGENRVELPASGGWEDEALVDIYTDYPAPFTITALGADFMIGG